MGSSLIKWIAENEPDTECLEVSVRGEKWKTIDFSKFDSILHVAGIAHVNSKKFKSEDYYKVNTELSIEVAKKAKKDGVPHFIFMSSIIVYNDSVINDGVITRDTVPLSKNAYGDSKIKAEEGIRTLEDDNFKIAILRPPMIYGPGSKGNYPRLAKLAKSVMIFPNYENRRSALFIDHLSSAIYQISNLQISDVLFLQNSEYFNTSKVVFQIASLYGRSIVSTRAFNKLIDLMLSISLIKKIFGNLTYDHDLSNVYDFNYNKFTFKRTIEITEQNSSKR